MLERYLYPDEESDYQPAHSLPVAWAFAWRAAILHYGLLLVALIIFYLCGFRIGRPFYFSVSAKVTLLLVWTITHWVIAVPIERRILQRLIGRALGETTLRLVSGSGASATATPAGIWEIEKILLAPRVWLSLAGGVLILILPLATWLMGVTMPVLHGLLLWRIFHRLPWTTIENSIVKLDYPVGRPLWLRELREETVNEGITPRELLRLAWAVEWRATLLIGAILTPVMIIAYSLFSLLFREISSSWVLPILVLLIGVTVGSFSFGLIFYRLFNRICGTTAIFARKPSAPKDASSPYSLVYRTARAIWLPRFLACGALYVTANLGALLIDSGRPKPILVPPYLTFVVTPFLFALLITQLRHLRLRDEAGGEVGIARVTPDGVGTPVAPSPSQNLRQMLTKGLSPLAAVFLCLLASTTLFGQMLLMLSRFNIAPEHWYALGEDIYQGNWLLLGPQLYVLVGAGLLVFWFVEAIWNKQWIRPKQIVFVGAGAIAARTLLLLVRNCLTYQLGFLDIAYCFAAGVICLILALHGLREFGQLLHWRRRNSLAPAASLLLALSIAFPGRAFGDDEKKTFWIPHHRTIQSQKFVEMDAGRPTGKTLEFTWARSVGYDSVEGKFYMLKGDSVLDKVPLGHDIMVLPQLELIDPSPMPELIPDVSRNRVLALGYKKRNEVKAVFDLTTKAWSVSSGSFPERSSSYCESTNKFYRAARGNLHEFDPLTGETRQLPITGDKAFPFPVSDLGGVYGPDVSSQCAGDTFYMARFTRLPYSSVAGDAVTIVGIDVRTGRYEYIENAQPRDEQVEIWPGVENGPTSLSIQSSYLWNLGAEYKISAYSIPRKLLESQANELHILTTHSAKPLESNPAEPSVPRVRNLKEWKKYQNEQSQATATPVAPSENSEIEVQVRASEKPLVLALAAREPVRWKLQVRPNARLLKIYLVGRAELADSTSVPVERIATADIPPGWGERSFREFGLRSFLETVREATSLNERSFQGTFIAAKFIVPPPEMD